MISSTPQTDTVHVIGGGLAGSEAAWQIANAGVRVVLHEMRPLRMTEAHRTEGLAELVCSNSFRSDDAANNAVGLLHAEMRRLGSLIMRCADTNQVPAGGALAVDRDGFSAAVTRALHDHPLIEIDRTEIAGLPPAEWGNVIVATGPLTSAPLADAIRELTDENALAFFDAIAPIVHKDSIDMSVAWFQSRYDKVGPGGTGADYINCPMTKEQYDGFVAALLAGEKVDFKDWETNTPYFDGCLPVEVMAERGPETLRHGPMKPVGLTNPHNPKVKAYGRMLATDHQAGLAEARSLASKLNVTYDSTSDNAKDLLNKNRDDYKDLNDAKVGNDWDKKFLDHAIDDHQHVLDKLQDASKNTTDPELRASLEKTTGKVQEHLTKAQDLKAKLP